LHCTADGEIIIKNETPKIIDGKKEVIDNTVAGLKSVFVLFCSTTFFGFCENLRFSSYQKPKNVSYLER